MSSPNSDKIAIDGTVIATVTKTLNASVKRMESLANTISLKTGGDAHSILVESRTRLTSVMEKFETAAKAGSVRHKKGCIAIVSLMATAYNALDSGLDALEDGDLTKADLIEVARDTRAAVIQARTLVKTDTIASGTGDAADEFLRKAEAAPKSKEGSGDEFRDNNQRSKLRRLESVRDAKQRAVEEDEQKKLDRRYANQDKHYDKIGDAFNANRVHLTKLPSAKTSKDPFVLVLLPVFPVTEAMIDKKYFENAGLKVKEVGKGLNMIENQILLGVNTAQLDTSTTKDGKKKIAKSTLRNRTLEIIRILSQKKHTTYHAVGSDGSSIDGAGRSAPKGASPGFVYYWLMDDRTLTKLETSLARNNISFDVNDWGLALPSK